MRTLKYWLDLNLDMSFHDIFHAIPIQVVHEKDMSETKFNAILKTMRELNCNYEVIRHTEEVVERNAA